MLLGAQFPAAHIRQVIGSLKQTTVLHHPETHNFYSCLSEHVRLANGSCRVHDDSRCHYLSPGMCEPPDFYPLFPSSFMPPADSPSCCQQFSRLGRESDNTRPLRIWYVSLAPPITQQI